MVRGGVVWYVVGDVLVAAAACSQGLVLNIRNSVQKNELKAICDCVACECNLNQHYKHMFHFTANKLKNE